MWLNSMFLKSTLLGIVLKITLSDWLGCTTELDLQLPSLRGRKQNKITFCKHKRRVEMVVNKQS